jgi:hypothetical protein
MIFVFKTSVKTKIQMKKLKPHIDKMLPCAKWNFDLKDSDKILRIDSEENHFANSRLAKDSHLQLRGIRIKKIQAPGLDLFLICTAESNTLKHPVSRAQSA